MGSTRRRRPFGVTLRRPERGSQTRSGEGKGGNGQLSRGPAADCVCFITLAFTFSEGACVRPCHWVFQRHLEAKAAYFKKIIQKADICPPISSQRAERTGRYQERRHQNHHHPNNQSETGNSPPEETPKDAEPKEVCICHSSTFKHF